MYYKSFTYLHNMRYSHLSFRKQHALSIILHLFGNTLNIQYSVIIRNDFAQYDCCAVIYLVIYLFIYSIHVECNNSNKLNLKLTTFIVSHY